MKTAGLFKLAALALVAGVIISNIYLAANFYNISSIHLADAFYWQSVNDVLVDNKVEKVQIVGEGIDFEISHKPGNIDKKQVVIYQVKRDSYRRRWQPRKL